MSIVCMSALRLTGDPNRSFGYWLFAQLAFGAIALLAFPLLLASGGLAGIYGTLGILLLALAVIARLIPTATVQAGTAAATPNVRAWSVSGIAGLAALLLLYIAFSAIWSFTGQIAGRDVPPDRAAYALSLAPLGGMAVRPSPGRLARDLAVPPRFYAGFRYSRSR